MRKEVNIKEFEKEKLVKIAEISLVLKSYEDIFSSFDPRRYSERALSVDFLDEAERASRDKEKGSIDLELLLPKKQRKIHYEKMIKRRLKDHFKKHFGLLAIEKKKSIWMGGAFVFSGIVIMFLAALVYFKLGESTLFSSFLVVLLEPAGWFLFWEGLDILIFEPKKRKQDYMFYEKMVKCRIQFADF